MIRVPWGMSANYCWMSSQFVLLQPAFVFLPAKRYLTMHRFRHYLLRSMNVWAWKIHFCRFRHFSGLICGLFNQRGTPLLLLHMTGFFKQGEVSYPPFWKEYGLNFFFRVSGSLHDLHWWLTSFGLGQDHQGWV